MNSPGRRRDGAIITALSLLLNSKAVEFCLAIAVHYIRVGHACVYRRGISMEKPIKIVVYFDYLSPWCYIAAVRLQCLEEEYGNKISISWKSYPLVVREIPNRLISSHSVESRRRAALEEDKISFSPGILTSHTPPQVCLHFEQLSVPSFKERKPFGVSTLLFSEPSSKRA